MKGMRIFEISPDGISEIDENGKATRVNLDDTPVNDLMTELATDAVINIARRAVMMYTMKNEDKMMKYVMSFDLSQKDIIARDFLLTAVTFVLEYTKRINNSIPNGEMPTREDVNRLMVNSNADLQEFLDQHVDKRFAEVYP